jgi:hypothetical protein
MKQFVPLTDEMLYSYAGPPTPLVPYRCGMSCRRESGQAREPFVREHDEQAASDSLSAHRQA